MEMIGIPCPSCGHAVFELPADVLADNDDALHYEGTPCERCGHLLSVRDINTFSHTRGFSGSFN